MKTKKIKPIEQKTYTKYSIEKNTRKSFTAGCNIVLHCNGRLKEMIKVAKNSPIIDNFILKKTYQFIDIIS